MKTLLILRHGQAERRSEAGDEDRALTERGARDAADMGRQIQETFGVPALVVTSDAVRARQTALIAAQVVGVTSEIDLRGAIYEARVSDLLEVVQSLPDTADCVLLVGHNPGLEQLAGTLDREAVAPPSLTPAALIALRLDVTHWQDIGVHCGRWLAHVRPEDHCKRGT